MILIIVLLILREAIVKILKIKIMELNCWQKEIKFKSQL